MTTIVTGCCTHSVSGEQEHFQPLSMTRPGKSLWDKCDHSQLCASSKCDDYTQRRRTMVSGIAGSKWSAEMNAFFRNHYSDVAMRAQQTYPTTNGGIWRRGVKKKKKFLSLSWHDKSVCISTPFITSRPRQWIEFQKPINKGDVHSAWQLSRASVPLSFTHPPSLLRLPPSLFSFPFCWND